jgi:hypothetical protein
MPHFTSSIRTAVGSMNFYFNSIETAFGNHYHLSTIGKNGKAIIFHMEQHSDRWRVVRSDDTPEWVVDVEEKLSQKITEHVSETYGEPNN